MGAKSNGCIATLIVAASEQDANLYYATRFWAPDAFIFLQVKNRKYLIMSDLELDRAKSESNVDEVLSSSQLAAQARKKGIANPEMTDLVDLFLKEQGVSQIRVPSTFPVALADRLRSKEYGLEVSQEPFFPERMVKNQEEVEAIRETIRSTEGALKSAIDVIARSEIKKGELWIGNKPLTSELVRKLLQVTLMGSDCLAKETIVAGGTDACDPHCMGYGPLKANWPIVLDVFPVSLKNRYFADISRTVAKGKPSDRVKTMYRLVQEGQEIAFKTIKPGVDGKAIHLAILNHFEKAGFQTGEKDGRIQGFFHGTGHGLGLEIHEPPRISTSSDILQEGQVVTVEPGLYYRDAGGIRIEDDVLVTKTGCEVLTTFPKILELD